MNPVLLTTTPIVSQEQEKDCDCACADMPSFVSHENKKKGLFIANKNNYLVDLIDNYCLLFSPYAPNGVSVTNKEGWKRYQSFAEKPQMLEQPFDHQLVDQNLLVPLNSDISFVSQSSTLLTAWLHITNACNLACTYCYIRKSSEKMSEEVGIKAIQHLVNTAKTKNFKILKLKYAGGEPTLDFKLVQKLHCYAIKLCKENNIELQAVLLSNGTLINEQWTDWLIENQVKLMLSIDGINEIHDLQRPTKNKTSSFAALKKGLQTFLLPNGIKPTISVTVTGFNANYVEKIIEWILENELPFSLNFYRENNQVNQLNKETLTLEEKAIIKGMLKAYQLIEKSLPTYPILDSLLDKFHSTAHRYTCGVDQNYLVIDQQGKIAQCQMQLHNTYTNKIQNLAVEEKTKCNQCLYRYRCSGGCPLETFRAHGRWDMPSPNCHIYQALYPEALRLEGLRLIKKGVMIKNGR